jgi:hypothetical protein
MDIKICLMMLLIAFLSTLFHAGNADDTRGGSKGH